MGQHWLSLPVPFPAKTSASAELGLTVYTNGRLILLLMLWLDCWSRVVRVRHVFLSLLIISCQHLPVDHMYLWPCLQGLHRHVKVQAVCMYELASGCVLTQQQSASGLKLDFNIANGLQLLLAACSCAQWVTQHVVCWACPWCSTTNCVLPHSSPSLFLWDSITQWHLSGGGHVVCTRHAHTVHRLSGWSVWWQDQLKCLQTMLCMNNCYCYMVQDLAYNNRAATLSCGLLAAHPDAAGAALLHPVTHAPQRCPVNGCHVDLCLTNSQLPSSGIRCLRWIVIGAYVVAALLSGFFHVVLQW